MIFEDKEQFYFCYHPSSKKDIREEFHTLTEFFVRQVDYNDEKGVHFAYTLHKSTMEDNYSLEEIMKRLSPASEVIVEKDYEEVMETMEITESVIEEKNDKWSPVRKIWDWAKRICQEEEDEEEDL